MTRWLAGMVLLGAAACAPSPGGGKEAGAPQPPAIAAAPAAPPIATQAEPASGEDKRKICGAWAELAKGIMAARQGGVPMRELMDRMSQPTEDPVITKMIIRAYDSPAFQTEGVQQRAITEFENWAYLTCMRGVDGA